MFFCIGEQARHAGWHTADYALKGRPVDIDETRPDNVAAGIRELEQFANGREAA